VNGSPDTREWQVNKARADQGSTALSECASGVYAHPRSYGALRHAGGEAIIESSSSSWDVHARSDQRSGRSPTVRPWRLGRDRPACPSATERVEDRTVHRLSTDLPFTCVTCELEISGSPTFHVGLPFCCAGCVAGGPCTCRSNLKEDPRVRHCLDVAEPDIPVLTSSVGGAAASRPTAVAARISGRELTRAGGVVHQPSTWRSR
jgi:hypothetical protein